VATITATQRLFTKSSTYRYCGVCKSLNLTEGKYPAWVRRSLQERFCSVGRANSLFTDRESVKKVIPEKKMVTLSIIALMIGIATIVPLAFFMSARAETTYDKSWFNFNVPYAYIKANSTDFHNGTSEYGYWQSMVLNVTINEDAKRELTDAEARIEYFKVQIYAENGPIINITYFVGANRTGTFDPVSFHFERNNWFDSNTTGGGTFIPNTDSNGVVLTQTGGSLTAVGPTDADWKNDILLKRIDLINNAEVLYIDIQRLGWVTFNGNSTVATLAEEGIIQHLELTKYGDGFLYNNLFTEDQLPQANLLSPLSSYGKKP
jgi:hypothetical protein